MMRSTSLLYLVLMFAASVLACGCKDKESRSRDVAENYEAKKMLEGVWIDADEETLVFMIKGDTIYYPDSTSRPVEFRIVGDTMILLGNDSSKYPIIKQEAHLFEFLNQNNDVVKLIKSDDPNDTLQFVRFKPVMLNQGKVIKSDTVVTYGDRKYHCYVQVNPTTYKVYRSSYNAEGIEIENIYYDNIIHISIFHGTSRMFSKNFRKSDFVDAVPGNMLKQSVLSDIKLVSVEDDGFHYITQLAIPDSPSSFLVKLNVSYDGKINVYTQK